MLKRPKYTDMNRAGRYDVRVVAPKGIGVKQVEGIHSNETKYIEEMIMSSMESTEWGEDVTPGSKGWCTDANGKHKDAR